MKVNGWARVVVVEEEDREAARITGVLTEHGHLDVVHAKDAAQALDATAVDDVCILLADIAGSGIDLVRRLRARVGFPYTYAIMLTSRGSAARLAEAFEAGADDFLAGPFDAPELVGRVRAAERIVHLERSLAVRCAELETTLRALDPTAAAESLARANMRLRSMRRQSSAAESLVQALPWEPMSAVLCEGLTQLVGEPFAPAATGERHAAVVGEVSMAEASQRLEVGATIVVDGASTKGLAGVLLGDENDVEGACTLVLEIGNVLLGCLKTAYSAHGYDFTVGLPSQPNLTDAQATYDAHGCRQRFAFTANGMTVEVWIRAAEKRDRSVGVGELSEGMVLVGDVHDARGMLLIRGGTRVTQTTVERLVGLIPDAMVSVT